MSRIAVVGVGAIGGAVAASLAEPARHELVLCSRTAIDGLQVRHPGGTSRPEARILVDPAGATPVDWVLLATKTHQTRATAPWLARLVGSGTRIAVLQNGVDHRERVLEALGESAAHAGILPVVVQLPAEKVAPGRIEQSADGVLVVPDDARGREFAALFEGARTKVHCTADFTTALWLKLLLNSAIGGLGALTLCANGAAGEPPLRDLALALMLEAADVARAEGAAIDDARIPDMVERIVAFAPDHWSSIAVDRREGRPMEWDARNAVIGRIAMRHHLETPLNDALTVLLRAVDARSYVR